MPSEPAVVSFELAGLPPSLNQRHVGHWSKRYKSDQRWKNDATLAGIDARNRSGHSGFPWPRVIVRYTFFVPTRGRHDWDNLVGGAKACLDGAVAARILADDSTSCVVAFGPHEYVVRPRKGGIRVSIERAP